MDENERIRLEKTYREMPDEELLEMLEVPENEYEQGIYDLVLAEANKRKLLEEAISPTQVSFKDTFLNSLYQTEAMLNLLEQKGILTKKEVLEEIKKIKATTDREKDWMNIVDNQETQ